MSQPKESLRRINLPLVCLGQQDRPATPVKEVLFTVVIWIAVVVFGGLALIWAHNPELWKF